MDTNQEGGFLTSWTNIEWVLGATWIVGSAMIAYIWRMALRVALLEDFVKRSTLECTRIYHEMETVKEGQETLRRDIRHDMHNALVPFAKSMSDLNLRMDRIIENRPVRDRDWDRMP